MNRATKLLRNTPSILSSSAIGGKKEGEGPLGDYFDKINEDAYMSTDTFEKGESQLQKQAVSHVLDKSGLQAENIDVMFGGDLLNQCVGTTFGIRDFGIPFLGIYGACSTMAEGLLLASLFVDGGYSQTAMAVTSSHFCTAERQYRFPLNYGGQRTPTSQWTATAGGALIVTERENPPFVRAVTIGKIVDLGVTDANNMGAAMAPAAYDTLSTFFKDTGKSPEDFDAIVTGDLGKVGSRILCELFERDNINIREKHKDCGMMIYDFDEQDVHAGGSGCGCAGSVLCGYFIPQLRSGSMKNILFAATGALMSPTVNQQGESIPGISHAVWISYDCCDKVPDIKFSKKG
ncbi:MAG: stage V sporulation protein AD [Ruminococcus sp.]|nr:stage V sporulation protein AD [Ruminococcus sp.]